MHFDVIFSSAIISYKDEQVLHCCEYEKMTTTIMNRSIWKFFFPLECGFVVQCRSCCRQALKLEADSARVVEGDSPPDRAHVRSMLERSPPARCGLYHPEWMPPAKRPSRRGCARALTEVYVRNPGLWDVSGPALSSPAWWDLGRSGRPENSPPGGRCHQRQCGCCRGSFRCS